jgi:hypothetical protein
MEREIDREAIMNKLIQSIIISAVVIAPLSSLGLIADATTHHTNSHVSTVSVEATRTGGKTKKVKKAPKKENTTTKKQVTKQNAVSTGEKPSSPATMTPSPGESSQPKTPSTSSESSAPTPPLNSTLDPMLGNPMKKPSSDVALPNPAAGTPTIPVFSPGSIANPSGDHSIPNPKLPTTLPTGLVK